MRALILNCTLKRSPEPSNTQRLADVVAAELAKSDVEVESIRVVDQRIEPGVETDMGDDWTAIHRKILDAEILVIASPTWLGMPSSVAHRVLERMDAMLSETDDQDRPVAYNRVAGVVVTGNEDGAHHVISEICGGLNDIGFTIPVRRGPTGTWAPVRARTTRTPTMATSSRRRPRPRWRRTWWRWRVRSPGSPSPREERMTS